ncbi:MAG: hypothetical protein MJ252_27245 [archaeon]|nr:hypothetical protein [archaeon]
MKVSPWKRMVAQQLIPKYTKIELMSKTTEGNLIDCNSKYLAVSFVPYFADKGCVVILDPTKKSYDVSSSDYRIKGHDVFVSNVKFSPFKENLLATCSQDASIKLWELPKDGLYSDITEEAQVYTGHEKRTIFSEFNPCCEDVMASGALDKTMQVWNMIKAAKLCEFTFNEALTDLQWNLEGTLLGAAQKEEQYIIDPRANSIVASLHPFQVHKPSRINFITEDTFLSSGFTGDGKKELKLYDLRKPDGDPLASQVCPVPSPAFYSFYDECNKLIYFTGKATEKYYVFDVNNNDIIPAYTYQSKVHKAICPLPKRYVDWKSSQLMQFCCVEKNNIFFEEFCILAKTKEFNKTIYPPIHAGEPSIDFNSWITGGNPKPIKKYINELNEPCFDHLPFEKVNADAPVQTMEHSQTTSFHPPEGDPASPEVLQAKYDYMIQQSRGKDYHQGEVQTEVTMENQPQHEQVVESENPQTYEAQYDQGQNAEYQIEQKEVVQEQPMVEQPETVEQPQVVEQPETVEQPQVVEQTQVVEQEPKVIESQVISSPCPISQEEFNELKEQNAELKAKVEVLTEELNALKEEVNQLKDENINNKNLIAELEAKFQ